MATYRLWLFLAGSAALLCVCGTATGQVAETPASAEQCIIVELYVADDQPASDLALAGARQLAETRSGIRLVTRNISSDKGRERLAQIASYFRFNETSTPVIYCCNQVIRFGKSAEDFRNQLAAALRIQVFTRVGCSRCQQAKEWLPSLMRKYPGLELVYREITGDPSARDDLQQLVRKYGMAATSTPVFHFCDQMVVGFDRVESTGVRIESGLSRWATRCPNRTPTEDSASGREAREEEKSGERKGSAEDRFPAREVAASVPFCGYHRAGSAAHPGR
jgi:glutaredoxin